MFALMALGVLHGSVLLIVVMTCISLPTFVHTTTILFSRMPSNGFLENAEPSMIAISMDHVQVLTIVLVILDGKETLLALLQVARLFVFMAPALHQTLAHVTTTGMAQIVTMGVFLAGMDRIVL